MGVKDKWKDYSNEKILEILYNECKKQNRMIKTTELIKFYLPSAI